MTNPPMTKRQKRVRTHNVATVIALLSFVGIAIGSSALAEMPLPISAILVLLMFVAILVMFATRNADEYTAAVWRAGTSLAFVITAAVMLFTPLAEGFYDGFTQAHTGVPTERDLRLDGFIVVVASFFVGNAWARIRGTV